MRSLWVVLLVSSMAATAGPPAPESVRPIAARAVADGRQVVPSVVAESQALVDALRVNDFRALIEAKASPKDVARMESEWSEAQERYAQRSRDEKSERHDPFDEIDPIWVKLRTPAGVDALVAEWQPLLAKEANDKVIQFNLGLALMLTQIADDEKMTIDETTMARDLVLATQRWANDTDWDDAARLRRAVDAVATFVRQSGLETPRELMALPLDEALAHGDNALRAAKQVAAAYDIEVDAMLDSVRLTEVDRDGDRATIRMQASVLGVALAHQEVMRWRNGEWIDAESADAMDEWERERENEHEKALNPPPPPPLPPQPQSGKDVPACGPDADFVAE